MHLHRCSQSEYVLLQLGDSLLVVVPCLRPDRLDAPFVLAAGFPDGLQRFRLVRHIRLLASSKPYPQPRVAVATDKATLIHICSMWFHVVLLIRQN